MLYTSRTRILSEKKKNSEEKKREEEKKEKEKMDKLNAKKLQQPVEENTGPLKKITIKLSKPPTHQSEEIDPQEPILQDQL